MHVVGEGPRDTLSFEVFPFSNFVNRYIQDSLVDQLVKNLPAVQKTLGLIPGSERSPGEGNGNPP